MAELEAQCARLAPLVEVRDWRGLSKLTSDMARERHAMMNAWDAAASARTPQFEQEIRERIARVVEYRAWYLGRLEEYRGGVSERLSLISRWKAYARSIAGKPRRQPALFSDVR
jgi:hypothetical protein